MERVLVVGGGVAGLASALALKLQDVEVVIVERDGPLPAMDPQDAFEHWKRPGVSQFHHSHILLSRLHTMIREHHPELLAELLAAGLVVAEIGEMLPSQHLAGYQPQADDADLLHLWGRRATFEYVLRRHVESLSHVRFICDARVEGLIADESEQGVRIKGLRIRQQDEFSELMGDVVIDASGSRSSCRKWLQELGVRVSLEEHPSSYGYYCRHYKLRDPSHPPSRYGTGANLDYLWYGIFYAEDGHFSVAISCPLEEQALNERLRRAEGFERVCGLMPAVARWTKVAVPTTQVFGAGGLANRWYTYGGEDSRPLLGYLPVGDSHLHTNPMYGRGCSSAFIQAHEMAQALQQCNDAGERARRYFKGTRERVRPHFDASTGADKLFLNRALLLRGGALRLPDRLLNYLYDAVWTPALLRSPLVAREMLKAMQMRELSRIGLRLAVLVQIAISFFRHVLRLPQPTPIPQGPGRAQLLSELSASQDEFDASAQDVSVS